MDQITGMIIEKAIRIHRGLGPGLLESVYEMVLCKCLERDGLLVERQKAVDFVFEGIQFKDGFRADLIVENQVVVELKSVEIIAPVHSKQLLTYLRLLNYEVGLLINFGNATLKEGIERVVNHHRPAITSCLRINLENRD